MKMQLKTERHFQQDKLRNKVYRINSNLVRLEIPQKRVVSTIAKTHPYADTDPIFRNLGILKFHDMHLLQLGLFMFSNQNRTLPLKFDCKFTLQKEIHSYHPRNSHLYRLPLCRTNIKQFSVFSPRT